MSAMYGMNACFLNDVLGGKKENKKKRKKEKRKKERTANRNESSVFGNDCD